MKALQLPAPPQITGARYRIGISGDHPTTDVLAPRGQPQGFGSLRAKVQDPTSKPLGVDQFARTGRAINDNHVGVARVLLVKSCQYLLKLSSKFHVPP